MTTSNSNERIRALLEESGLSQTDFAKKAHIQKSALSNYLKGDRKPRQDQIMKISDAFQVNPAWILGYDVEKSIAVELETANEAALMQRMLAYSLFFAHAKKLFYLPKEQQTIVFNMIDALS